MKKYTLIPSFILLLLISSAASSTIYQQHPLPNEDMITNMQPTRIQSENAMEKITLTYPRSSIPTFVEIGGNFTLTFESNDFNQVYAYISTAYEPVVDEFWLTIDTIWEQGEQWYATVSVPSIVPEELYNLTLLVDQEGRLYSSSQPRAVSVIEEFSDNFSFIHIADFHVGDPRGFLENIWQTIGMKSLKRCIKEINLLHPDFVIISGDLVFGQFFPFEYSREYEKCYELLQLFDVPTFLCPGNHDGYRRLWEDGLEFWERYFGPQFYSFDYGAYQFLSINSYDWSPISRFALFFLVLNWGGSIREQQLEWIEQVLSSSTAQKTFMFLHHNPLWDTQSDSLLRRSYHNREELLSLIDHYNVSMVLAGHVHYDNVTLVNETIFITTTTPESSIGVDDGYWGYRLIEIQGGDIFSYNYKEPKYSIPSYHLDYIFQKPNVAVVTNDLDKDIVAYVQFLLPRGTYSIENGVIYMQRDDELLSELYVVADVPARSEITISLTQETYTFN